MQPSAHTAGAAPVPRLAAHFASLVDGEDVPVLFSPMYKQAFDLRTGVCLSDPAKALGTWAVAVLDSRVFVGSQVTDEAPLRRPEEGLARAG